MMSAIAAKGGGDNDNKKNSHVSEESLLSLMSLSTLLPYHPPPSPPLIDRNIVIVDVDVDGPARRELLSQILDDNRDLLDVLPEGVGGGR